MKRKLSHNILQTYKIEWMIFTGIFLSLLFQDMFFKSYFNVDLIAANYFLPSHWLLCNRNSGGYNQ